MKSFYIDEIETIHSLKQGFSSALCDYLIGYQATKPEAMVYWEKEEQGIVEREFPSHFSPGE